MYKAKFIIPILIVLSLIIPAGANSQDKNLMASEILMGSSDTDKNPQRNLFKLYQNAQTELNDVTVIKFDLVRDADVSLIVIANRGNILENLIEGEIQTVTYSVFFKFSGIIALNEISYKIKVNGVTETKSMLGKQEPWQK